jgi:hypothetical protein
MPININATPKKKSTQRQLLPIGQSMARLVQVIDFGLQPQRPYNGQEKLPAYEVLLTFEFPEERIEQNGESRPMWKSKRIKLSSDERSTCYKLYNKLDPENKHRGDFGKLIGKECAALIVHDKGTGKNVGIVYDNIADINPLMKGMTVPPLENDPVVFDLTSPNLEVFESLPEWMQGLIKDNLEFDGSKLERAIMGQETKWTARAEGDAPHNVDSDQATTDDVPTSSVEDSDEPW